MRGVLQVWERTECLGGRGVEEKRPFERHRQRWEQNNNNLCLKDIKRSGMQ